MSAHAPPSVPATALDTGCHDLCHKRRTVGLKEQGGLTGRHTLSGRTRNLTRSPDQLGHHLPSAATSHAVGPGPRCRAGGAPVAAWPPAPSSLMPPLLFLPQSPIFITQVGRDLVSPGRRAPSETLQRTLLALRAVSARALASPPLSLSGSQDPQPPCGSLPSHLERGLPLASLPGALGTRGQVFSARGAPAKPPSSLCMKGKEPRVPSAEKTCASDSVAPRPLTRRHV